MISRVVSLVVFLAAGNWIKDANVPYRLMQAKVLKPALEKIPENAFFANILLSSLLAKDIRWEPIRFRKRTGGNSMLRWRAMLGFAQKLFGELRELRSGTGRG